MNQDSGSKVTIFHFWHHDILSTTDRFITDFSLFVLILISPRASGKVCRRFMLLFCRQMIRKRKFILLCFSVTFAAMANAQQGLWLSDHGSASIKSEAPLELIKAESSALRGIIDPASKSFAFTIRINSFEGFNSEIQQTHFLENYLEQKKYPQATFKGKFIEDIPFDTPGSYSVRAKGNLEIHGVTKERIIRGNLIISEGSARIQTHFLIPVADHGITIPKIVMQKIAEEIDVNIDIQFLEGKAQ